MAIRHRRGVSPLAPLPRSLSTSVSLTKLGAAPLGTSPLRSFLLPLLRLSSSLLSSLPALLSTRGLCNALFTKDVSRGTRLSPPGVFRCLAVCGCVCVRQCGALLCVHLRSVASGYLGAGGGMYDSRLLPLRADTFSILLCHLR